MDQLPFSGVTRLLVGIIVVMKKQQSAMPKQNNIRAPARRRARRTRRLNNGSQNGNGNGNFLQSAAVSVQELQGSSVPILSGAGSRGGDLRVRVQRREFISDISGSVAYSVLKYAVNPGLATTFPWLSNIAKNFESYQFNGLMFQYRNATSTAAVGKVLYSIDWDAADQAPSSKQQQLQERTKADGAAWMNFDLRCDKADLLKFGVQRYVRDTTLTSNLDIKTYDVGNLWVGTQAQANANDIGELWVVYDVELITPNSVPPTPDAALLSESVIGAGGAISVANIFGNVPLLTGGPVVSVSAANTLTFLVTGQYLLEMEQDGTVINGPSTFTGTAPSTFADATINGTTSITEVWLLTPTAGQTVIITPDATTITATTVRLAPYMASNT